MMILDQNGVFIVLLIYADDILITSKNIEFINDLTIKLNSILVLKDLG